MGFRLAPRKVAPLPPQPGWSPVFVHFGSGSPCLGESVDGEDERVCFRNFSSPFSHTGNVDKSHQQGLGQWGRGDHSAQRGRDDSPKRTQYILLIYSLFIILILYYTHFPLSRCARIPEPCPDEMAALTDDLSAARPALHACVRSLNALGAEDLRRLAVRTLRAGGRDGAPEASNNAEEHLVSGLAFIFRAATRAGAASDDLAARLGAQTNLSPDACTVLAECYGASRSEQGDGGSGGGAVAAAKVMGLGKFVSLDWKVGVGIKSSNCENLCAPYVSLLVRVSRDGKVEAHSMELSIEEFGNFAESLKECSAAMSSLG